MLEGICATSTTVFTQEKEARDGTNHPRHPVLKDEFRKVMENEEDHSFPQTQILADSVFQPRFKDLGEQEEPASCNLRVRQTWNTFSMVKSFVGRRNGRKQEEKEGSCVHRLKFFAFVDKTAIGLQMGLSCWLTFGMDSGLEGI